MAAIVTPPAVDKEEPLFFLQLQVARRADELARSEHGNGISLHCWLLAEAEILERTLVSFTSASDGRGEA